VRCCCRPCWLPAQLVDFTDDYDSRGTRVTSRKYADGHVVIETPRADSRVN
jgi:hypothetical protein